MDEVYETISSGPQTYVRDARALLSAPYQAGAI